MSLLNILIVLFVLSLLFGGFGYRAGWGYYSGGPVGLIIVVVVVLLLLGRL
jgi:hypothetical protein